MDKILEQNEKCEKHIAVTDSCHARLSLIKGRYRYTFTEMIEAALNAWEREQLSTEIDLPEGVKK